MFQKICFLWVLLAALHICTSQLAKGKSGKRTSPYGADILPNKFDWELGKVVDKNEFSNMVLSTISVKLVLGMLYVGALGNTAKEIEQALDINPEHKHEYISQFLTIINTLEKSDGGYEFDIGTKIFLDKSATIKPEFNHQLTQYFNSSVETVNFKDSIATKQVINDWTRQVTHGRIQQLVTDDESVENTAMILLNAIYFKGLWEKPFPETLTKPGTFHLLNGNKVEVPFMTVVDDFFSNTIPEINSRILRLPYVGKKFAMYILLPINQTGIQRTIEGLTQPLLRKAISSMTEAPIQVTLPKFHFESTLILGPILKELGLQEMFTSKANFSNIGQSSEGSLSVSNVLQKAGLEVNEQGSIAYAATEALLDNRMGELIREEFSIKHPFMFIIMDETAHVIAFVGKVINPLFHGKPVVSIPADSSSIVEESNPVKNNIDQKTGIPAILPVESHISERYNFFDYEFLQKITQLKSGNIVVSPESIKAALSLVMEGAKGKTEQEIKEALRLSDDRTINANLLSQRQIALKEKSPNVVLLFENKIFLTANEKLSDRYQSTIRNQYYSDVNLVNFQSPDTVSKINNWVNNVTRGLISRLVNPGDFNGNTKLFLANCIYFKGEWAQQFDVQSTTNNNCFYVHGTTCQKAYLMEMTTQLKYGFVKTLDASALELPFKGGRFSMIILLPRKRDGLSGTLRDILLHPITDILADMSETEVNVVLPRFTIEFSSSLVEPLQMSGIKEAFKTTADLGGILADSKHSLYIGNVIHKAKIEVNEVGAKAAAATGIDLVTLSLPLSTEFRADHPFIFFIHDKSTGGILFEGIVDSPDPVKEVSSPPSYSQAAQASQVGQRSPVATQPLQQPSAAKPSDSFAYQQPQPIDPEGVHYPLKSKPKNTKTLIN